MAAKAAKSGIMNSLTGKQDRLAKYSVLTIDFWLQTLVDELNAEERSALASMLSRKNGPLALLPLEAVIEIFTYLPISAPWRLQLVCRQWRDVLSSDQLLETSLARRETHNPSDSARSPEMNSNDTIKAKVGRMQAMRCGKPTSSTLSAFTHQERRRFPLPQVHRDFALKADHIAYIDQCSVGTERVVVRDLVKGTVKTLVGTAREAICGIALTTTVVAFLGYHGKLYVHSLRGGDPESREVRLPSASVTAFAADGDVVALALQIGRRGEYMIALYDYTRGCLKEFTASWSGDNTSWFPPPHNLLVDARQGFLDVFGGHGYFESILHTRFSFTGVRISTCDFKVSNANIPNGDIQPTGDRDMYIFRTDAIYQWDMGGEERNIISRTAVFFDARTATLEERAHVIGPMEHYKASQRLDSTLWKDTVITCGLSRNNVKMLFSTEQEASLPSDKELWQASGETISPHKALRLHTRFRRQGQLDLSQEYVMRHNTDRSWPDHDQADALYVNDSFIVAVGHTPQRSEDKRRRIHVFCFDEELHCEGFDEGALSLEMAQ